MRVKRHFNVLFQDRILCWTFIVCGVLLANHIYMIVDSGYMVEPMIRASYCLVYIVAALIFGRRCWDFQMLFIAFSILYFNRWNNYTSWVLVVAVSYRNYRCRRQLYAVYALTVCACLLIGHRDMAHMVLHYCHCFCIYVLLSMARAQYNSEKPLDLLDDELVIIRQIADGKLKKEIKEFSKNTVTKKIRQACARNRCNTEGELLWRYRKNPL